MKEKCLGFERGIERIYEQVTELERLSLRGINYSGEIWSLLEMEKKTLRSLYFNLSAWNTVQVARCPYRPAMKDYINGMVNDFVEMHGDRQFEDDRVLIGGFGMIGKHKAMIIGHYKDRSLKLGSGINEREVMENSRCYTGCPNPGGFRKALRLMKLAEKFGVPILTLIDTPGAYPAIVNGDCGQAQAIAVNLKYMPTCKVPIVSVIIGEGGSGGALGIGVANKLAMLKYSYYSVASPEAVAAILWRDGTKREESAESSKLTARDNLKLKTIEDIIDEPIGGAQRNVERTIYNVKRYVIKKFDELSKMSVDELVGQRNEMIKKRASAGRKWGEHFEKKKKIFFRK